MDLREVAAWLANVDGSGATDEEFAEAIVLAYKMWQENSTDIVLSESDMNKFSVDEFIADLADTLEEIIFCDDVCESCWWKKE